MLRPIATSFTNVTATAAVPGLVVLEEEEEELEAVLLHSRTDKGAVAGEYALKWTAAPDSVTTVPVTVPLKQ